MRFDAVAEDNDDDDANNEGEEDEVVIAKVAAGIRVFLFITFACFNADIPSNRLVTMTYDFTVPETSTFSLNYLSHLELICSFKQSRTHFTPQMQIMTIERDLATY